MILRRTSTTSEIAVNEPPMPLKKPAMREGRCASSGKNRKICLYSLDGDFEKTVAGETSVDTVCYVSDSKLFYACAEKGESEDEKELNYRVYRYDLETEEQTQLTEFTAYYITGMDDSRIICYGADGEKIVNY